MKVTGLLLLFSLILGKIFAGDYGKLKGHVTDSKTGEPLCCTNVVLVRYSYGASTDSVGFFLIDSIPPGKYIVHASNVTSISKDIENVKIESDSVVTLNIRLDENPDAGTLYSDQWYFDQMGLKNSKKAKSKDTSQSKK